MLNGGPQLELKLVSERGDESVFHISATKSPRIFEKLKEMDGAQVELSERARQTKLYKTPFIPYLNADINEQGHLELSPVLKLNSASKKSNSFLWKNYVITRSMMNGYGSIIPIAGSPRSITI